MKCPNCNNEYSSTSLIINYCPFCGTNISGETPILGVDVGMYDSSTIYTHCKVQVLENTITGETSIGWRRLEGCEEI